jgi:trimeric autotransporter adhesin
MVRAFRNAGSGHRPNSVRLLIVGLTTALVALGLALPVLPGLGRTAEASAAATALPTVPDGEVDAFAVSGTRTYVAGTFTQVTLPSGTVVAQPRLFAYLTASGAFDPSFRPTVNGDVLAMTAAPGGGVYLGGTFTTVGGAARARLAKVRADGSVDPIFRADANSRVTALATSGNRLFVGGQFSTVGGLARGLLAEVNGTSGAVSSGFNLPITGSAAPGGFTTVHSLATSGTRLLVAHDGLKVGGQSRVGVAVLDISTAAVTVSPWFTNLWADRLPKNGGAARITAAAWAPDGTWFATSNTGGDGPPTNDTVERFDVSAASPVVPRWITRQFDSSYSVAVGQDGTVYSGGHFNYTEAPGSTEPWPGLDNVNYGFGPGGGARVLGSQVVARNEIDALDPQTGKARNWWGTADGHHGVVTLQVDGHRLLVGHDGLHVGTAATGRHGVLPTVDTPPDTTRARSSVTAPLIGAVGKIGSQHVTGQANAPAGVSRMALEVKRTGTNLWLHADGSWGTFFAFTPTLASPGGTSTTWSIDISLPAAGDYSLFPKAIDQAGAGEPTRYEVPIQLDDSSNTPPQLTTLHPTQDEQDFTTHTITIDGTAADPDGVASVSFSLFSQTLGGYLHADGSIGTFAQFATTLDHPGAALVAWSRSVSVPSGDWALLAVPKDTKGAALPGGVRTTFVMAPGDPAPTATISAPVTNTAVPAAITITGTAADDTGVKRVLVQVADTRFGLGPQIGGGFGRAVFIPATVATPGAKSTTWSLSVSGLMPAVYAITAEAVDPVGLTTAAAARPKVSVRQGPIPPNVGPDTGITGPVPSTFRATGLSVPLTGTANYPVGVASLWLVARDTRTGEFLQHDGSTALTFDHLSVPVTSPGAATTTWSHALTLPRASSWQVDALAVGKDGGLDWTRGTAAVTYLVFPGDADPTLQYDSPVNGTHFPDGKIAAGGRAFDDVGVAEVLVEIRDTANPQRGLRADGTIGTPQFIRAFVTNAGGTFTNWNYVSPPMPAGGWTVLAVPIDSVGKGTLTVPSRTVSVP